MSLERLRSQARKFQLTIADGGPDLTCFDEQAWFMSAYYTFQRTLWGVFSPLTDDQKNRARDLVFRQLPHLENDSVQFKKAWSALLQRLITLSQQPNGSNGISLGHAQKLVSIILKYAYVADRLEKSDLPTSLRMMVQNCRKHLPVPLDNIVLKCLVVEKKLRFWRIHCTPKGSPWINEAEAEKDDGYWVRWSRLQNLNAYWDIQNKIREMADSSEHDPMGYELVELWSRSP